MNKKYQKLNLPLAFLVILFPFHNVVAQFNIPADLPPAPAISVEAVIQNFLNQVAIVSSILFLFLIIIFGIIYFFKDIEGKKKVKKFLLCFHIALTISLLIIIIINVFFWNFICYIGPDF